MLSHKHIYDIFIFVSFFPNMWKSPRVKLGNVSLESLYPLSASLLKVTHDFDNLVKNFPSEISVF